MMIAVIDVFAGCGGLSEGFSQLNNNGTFPFDVRLHIEKEKSPIRTLLLRTFYHQFRESEVPESYYAYVRGQMDLEDLFRHHPTRHPRRNAAVCGLNWATLKRTRKWSIGESRSCQRNRGLGSYRRPPLPSLFSHWTVQKPEQGRLRLQH